MIYQDIMLGPALAGVARTLARWQPGIVVLAPTAATLAERDHQRAKTGCIQAWTPDRMVDAPATTPRLGLWLDAGELSVDETVDLILANARHLRRGIGPAAS